MTDQNAFTIPTQAERTVPPTPSLPVARPSRWGWITESRKARIALASIVMIVLVRLLSKLGFSSADITEVRASVAVIAGIWMHSIALEDAKPQAPAVVIESAEKNDPAAPQLGSQQGSLLE